MEDSIEKTGEASRLSQSGPGQDDMDADERDVNICTVRLRPGQTPIHCDTGETVVEDGEWLVVRLEHGIEVGVAVGGVRKVKLKETSYLPLVERLASTREIELYYLNLDKERHAREVCLNFIKELNLDMKLIRVEREYEGGKVTFYYSADGRVDFRELVKQLVGSLQIRVEMRQIGIRHEARMIGGVGNCGRELCCSLFLENFVPVSIKMAKTQNLPLNPNKISGFCGRLLCCLTFEYDTYREISAELPTLGKRCETPYGDGRVTRVDILRQKVNVALDHGEFAEFTQAELTGAAPVTARKTGKEQHDTRPSEWKPAWPGAAKGSEVDKGGKRGGSGVKGEVKGKEDNGNASAGRAPEKARKKAKRKKRKRRPARRAGKSAASSKKKTVKSKDK